MGTLFDLLKEVPLSAVLKEKIATMEAENGALSTENAILKDDKRELQAEIVKLKDEIQRLTHTGDLHETEIKILVYLTESTEFHNQQNIAEELGIDKTRVEYFLQALIDKEYIHDEFSSLPIEGMPVEYVLDQKGKEFLIKNNLIP